MKKAISEWFVKNKIKILIVIICILLIFLVNRLLVFIGSINRNSNTNQLIGGTGIENDIIYNSVTLESIESVTMGDDMNKTQAQLLDTVDEFISYCNEQKVDEAYNLLSDDCKQELYPTVEDFRNSYYNRVFNGQRKNVSLSNWNGNIYKVEINEDSLSTGVYTEGNTLQDYITIVADDEGNPKLYINSYVGREELQKTGSNRNVEVTAIDADTYMEYQTVTFKVTNNSNSEIMLDDKTYPETMYIEDENGIKYPAYAHEINDAELRLTPIQSYEITIKYYSSYGTRKNITSVAFSGVVYNYTAYRANSSVAKDYGSIIVDLE